MKKLFAGLLLGLVVAAVPVAALAADFRQSNGSAGAITLGKTQSAKNLYIAANTVDISGAVKSDAAAAGNTINVSGPVEGDLFAVGSSINLMGTVGRNARVGGQTINVTGNVGEDLFVGGNTVTVSPEAKIGGDLVAAAANLNLNGPVDGDVKIGGGFVSINSKIGGNVVIYGGTVTLGDNANIAGNLKYTSDQQAQISSQAVVSGKIDFQKTQPKKPNYGVAAGAFGALGLLGFLMGFVVLIVLVYLLPKASYNLVKYSLGNFWANLGWGFLVFAVAPMALIILCVTVVGLKLAGMVLLVYGALLTIAFLVATLAIGSQIVKWIEKKDYRVDWLSALVGTVAVVILGLIPFVGGLIVFAVGLVVLGQLRRRLSAFLKSQRK